MMEVMRIAITTAAAAGALVLALTGPAGAATSASITVGSTAVTGTTLSVSPTGSPSFGITLNGADQTASYSLPLQVVDIRGSGAGWNLTITSTTFSTGTHTFPTSASTIAGVSASCNSGSTCTVPSNNVSNGSLALPAGSTSPSAVKFENAGTNSGLGEINLTTTVHVVIPANVFAGTYTSTVTVAIAAGP